MAVTEIRDINKLNWFKHLGASFKGIVSGFIIFLLGFPLLFWNEGRAVKTAKRLAEGSGAVVSVSSDAVDPANEGKLVHVSGMVSVDGALSDDDFGISSTAVRLTRKVEVFQWVEDEEHETITVDGKEKEKITYTYSKEWCDEKVDSSGFKEAGHDNGYGVQRFEDREVYSDRVTLGAFTLSESNIHHIHGSHSLAFAPDYVLPEALAGAQLVNGAIYVPGVAPAPIAPLADSNVATNGTSSATGATGTNAVATAAAPAQYRQVSTQPEIGDLRITFTVVEPHEISIVEAQSGSSFAPWKASDGKAISLQRDGVATAEEMFTDAQNSNKMLTRILRIVGFLLMFFGLRSILSPLAVLVDVIPLVNRIVSGGISLVAGLVAAACALATIALAWVAYRPLIAIPLLVVAVALIVLALRKKGSAAKA